MRKLLFAAVAGLALAAGSSFGAEVKYSSDDVVNFLVQQANLGAQRGVCVGTAQECATQAKPAGFDVYVNFELNSAQLTPDAMNNLKQVAVALADPRLQGAKFQVDGYTDASGTDGHNLLLSQQRADSVAKYLHDMGVPQDKLAAVGLGETSPRMPNPYDPLNRRVELTLNLN